MKSPNRSAPHDDHQAGSHLEMEDLLALRDGTGTAAAAEHLRSCPDCRHEVERLHQVRAQLKALPSQGPSRDLWPSLAAAVRHQRRARLGRQVLRFGLAGAAAALVVVALAAALQQRERSLERRELQATLVDLRERSQLLDGELRALRDRSLSSWRAEAIVRLEDELDGIDALLAESKTGPPSGDQVALWLSRLELQGAMVEMHTARVTHVDL